MERDCTTMNVHPFRQSRSLRPLLGVAMMLSSGAAISGCQPEKTVFIDSHRELPPYVVTPILHQGPTQSQSAVENDKSDRSRKAGADEQH